MVKGRGFLASITLFTDKKKIAPYTSHCSTNGKEALRVNTYA